ncbi:MAG: type VI secretion system-associated protein TagF [Betaproteobacteria bacterium]
MRGAEPAAPDGFSVGWYGKIPGTGDFIARRVPGAFSRPWDAWLQEVMDGSRARLGGEWQDAFLSMPPWRFVLSSGLVTPNAWAGLMVPSVDAVGRYFPLTVASPLPAAPLDLVATLHAAAAWFDDIEALALSALAPKADTRAIDAALAANAFRGEWLRAAAARPGHDDTVPMRTAGPQMLCVPLGQRLDARAAAELQPLAARLHEPCAAWLCEETEVMQRCLLLTEGLPPAASFCAMMDARWPEHGWGSRELRAGGGA